MCVCPSLVAHSWMYGKFSGCFVASAAIARDDRASDSTSAERREIFLLRPAGCMECSRLAELQFNWLLQVCRCMQHRWQQSKKWNRSKSPLSAPEVQFLSSPGARVAWRRLITGPATCCAQYALDSGTLFPTSIRRTAAGGHHLITRIRILQSRHAACLHAT